MAAGDHAGHYHIFNSLETVGLTTSDLLVLVPDPNTDALGIVQAVVGAYDETASAEMIWINITAMLRISSGILSQPAKGSMTADVDTASPGWTIDTAVESNTIFDLRVTGAAGDTVRWWGRLTVDFVEV